MIVLDTSFLVARANPADAHHAAAFRFTSELDAGDWGMQLLPEYVVVEFLNVAERRCGREPAIAAATALLRHVPVEFVPCSDVFLHALDVFRNQRTTRLSLADCAILAIAREREAGHVATFDAEFRNVKGIDVVPA